MSQFASVNLNDLFGHGDLLAVVRFEARTSALPIRQTPSELPFYSRRIVHDFDAQPLRVNPGHHIRPPDVRSVHVRLGRPQRGGERLLPVLSSILTTTAAASLGVMGKSVPI